MLPLYGNLGGSRRLPSEYRYSSGCATLLAERLWYADPVQPGSDDGNQTTSTSADSSTEISTLSGHPTPPVSERVLGGVVSLPVLRIARKNWLRARRARCDLSLPDADDGYQRQYLDSDEWSVTESTLTARDGEYFLYIGFRRAKNDTERNTAEDGTVLWVEFGIGNLAVTSTASFVSGRELTHDLREFEKVRSGLQRTGTRSTHRTLEQSSGRELRYVRDVLHRASNAPRS